MSTLRIRRRLIFGMALAMVSAFSGSAAGSENGHSVIVLEPETVAVSREADGTASFACRNVQWLNQPGEPNMPWQVMTVLLPPDASLATVSARLSNARWERVQGKWTVRPAPPAAMWHAAPPGAGPHASRRLVVWPKSKRIVDGRDAGIYEQDAVWPPADIRLVATGRLRKWRLAQVAVPLVRWNPVSGTLEQLASGAVVLSYQRTGFAVANEAQRAELLDSIGQDAVRRITVNFEQDRRPYEQAALAAKAATGRAPGTPAVTQTTPGYTIITTSDIVAASSELSNFVAHKQSKGFAVQVITETDFGGGIGDTAAENIRAWLQQHYISDNILYVLLIGNPHPSYGEVPMKMLYPRNNDGDEYPESPSDYYFADLTGNWDLDGDGYYGEWSDDFGPGGVDRTWDVLVGRIPWYPAPITEGGVLYDSGPPRPAVYYGQDGTWLGFMAGNIEPGREQRWAAHPFTLPQGTWQITHIDVDYHISFGRDFDLLHYIIWNRTGQVRPETGDEVVQGSVPAPVHRDDPRIGESENFLHQIPVNFQLAGGDYYLTIYAERSNGQQGAAANWIGNTEFGIPLLGPVSNPNPGVNAFFWRSEQFSTPGFQEYNLPTSTWASSPGQNPDQLYTASITVYGNPAPAGSEGIHEQLTGPLADTTDLDHILAKIMAYENALQSQATWRRNILLPMKSGEPSGPPYSDPLLNAWFLGEEIKEAVVLPKPGWGYHRVYDEPYWAVPPPETTPCTVETVTSAWSGSPSGVVVWATHGLETVAVDVMDGVHAATLDDNYPVFTFHGSCLNAHPETADNLAYSLLRNGAVCALGATRVSAGGTGQMEFAGTPMIGGMAVGYATLLIRDELDSGRSLYDMKQALVPFDSMTWLNYPDYNIYGCPAVGLYSYQADGMTVSPGAGLSAQGDAGGPFAPENTIYTIENNYSTTIDYQITKSAAWVSLDGGDGPLAGTLTPGQRVDVTVSINSNADGLWAGRYSDTVAFSNLTTGVGDTIRRVSLQVDFLYGGTTIQPSVNAVGTDAAGNVFVTGYPTYGSAKQITKLAPDGSEIWSRTFEGFVIPSGLAVDRLGNVVVIGTFSGTIDFDTTAGEDWHSSSADDIFVTKLMHDGSYAWTNTVGGSGWDWGQAVACDRTGNIYATGSFNDTVDFDPSTGEDWHSANGLTRSDIFVTKYGADGAYLWTRTMGSNYDDGGRGITVDSDGSVVLAGFYQRTVDFDPSGGVDLHTSNGHFDAFVTKLHSDGNYAWTRTIGGTGYEQSFGIAADQYDNVLVTGYFDDYLQPTPYIVDFDPTEGTDLHLCHGGQDIFVTKLGADGSYAWTRTIGSFNQPQAQTETASAIAVDGAGNPVLTGYIGCCSEVDFDPTVQTDWHTGDGWKEIFVTRLLADGSYAWTGLMGGSDDDRGYDVAVDRYGNVVVVGEFGQQGGTGYSADLDPTGGEDWYTSSDNLDGFVTKISRAAVPVILGDGDHDGDVDQTDYNQFVLCFTGPDAGPVASGCEPFDFDGDDDIDCDDWGQFVLAWTEPGTPPEFAPCTGVTVIPAVSEWGMILMTLLLLTMGTLVIHRQDRKGRNNCVH